jgi:phage terminase large subunit-like protein
MTPIGQGIASMSAPTKELLRLVQTKKIRHNGNDVLTWMADCFSVIRDTQDNVKPSKPKRNRDRKRIDGIQAGINGLARLIVNRKPLVKPKVLFV